MHSKEALKLVLDLLIRDSRRVLIKAIVYFIKETFLHSKEALKLELDHITIPEQKPISCAELDLD